MSHYLNIVTQIKDTNALVAALIRVGINKNGIEIHEKATNLYGYHGDKRADVANVIIRRKYIGGSSNDIGFVKGPDGRYSAIISEFDKNSMNYNDQWMRKLVQYYGVEKAKVELAHRHLRYVEDVTEKNCPRLRVLLS